MTSSVFEVDNLDGAVVLRSQSRKVPAINLAAAIVGDPVILRSIDEASSVEIQLADHGRDLLLHDAIDERSWIVIDGVHYELVGLSKSGDLITLVFEDAIAASLRRVTSRLVIPRGTMTRAKIVERLAREPRSNVPVDVDDDKRGPVRNPITRAAKGDKGETSWDVLGSKIAEPVRWRRFSTGRRLVVGGDPWLLERSKPTQLRENRGAVLGPIDFDLDVGRRADEATLTVSAVLRTLEPGAPVELLAMGPASGKWLVAENRRRLTSTTTELRLTRPTKPLKEPKREKGPGDAGDPDFTPGQDGEGAPTGGGDARSRMVNFALSQRGDTYVYGANGPDAWDCSGLVQAATRAGGRELVKPSASQWQVASTRGRRISVAEGVRTRGALLFRIGVGEYNHVAISLGDGNTVEARGTGYGVGVFGNASGGGWTGAALWI